MTQKVFNIQVLTAGIVEQGIKNILVASTRYFNKGLHVIDFLSRVIDATSGIRKPN